MKIALNNLQYLPGTGVRTQRASSNFGLILMQTRFYAQDTYARAAKDLSQRGLEDQESQLDDAIAQEKEKQTRTPWHREGSQVPPVKRQRSAGAMTKGNQHDVGRGNQVWTELTTSQGSFLPRLRDY